jgi:GR25 family glycosyltransferase involved in LPS biosynthesis
MISKYCILYEKSQKRVENYNNNKEIIVDLEKFGAIDTVNEFSKYSQISNKYVTNNYIEYSKTLLGKLGCNLSHLMLLEHFINNISNDWLLVLEDDVILNNYNELTLINLILKAEKENSHFIQLYTHPRFLKRQARQFERLDFGLYKMMPQLGCLAYLISKTGAKKILVVLPINNNIDVFYSQQIKKLNSMCYINDIFQNGGQIGRYDHNILSSIIYRS